MLRACRFIQAREIAFDPRVRTWLRHRYHSAVAISTQPTPRGKKEIDAWHPLRSVKRIMSKPATNFKNSTQFLLIQKAEALGLISKKISVSREEVCVQRSIILISISCGPKMMTVILLH